VAALRALEKTFGRVQALWKPVATEEAFENVRRRLFEEVKDVAGQVAVFVPKAKVWPYKRNRQKGLTDLALKVEKEIPQEKRHDHDHPRPGTPNDRN
jgi:hypothetical protein